MPTILRIVYFIAIVLLFVTTYMPQGALAGAGGGGSTGTTTNHGD
jgi:hypothetical protein